MPDCSGCKDARGARHQAADEGLDQTARTLQSTASVLLTGEVQQRPPEIDATAQFDDQLER